MSIAAPLHAVGLKRGGRHYGQPQPLEDRVRQEPAPEIGRIFVEDLVASSAILALSPEATRAQIIAAYGTDIGTLAARQKEADGFMLAVLECGMDRAVITQQDKRNAETNALKRLLEPLGINPQIALTAERSAMAPAELVAWLKDEYRAEIDRIARRIATTLHYLADHHVVGLVDWTSPDVCKFHYFAFNVRQAKTSTSKRTGDILAWNTLTTRTETTTETDRTRHTHHVVDAAVNAIADYARPMPPRITKLLETAPPWLRPHLVVIDGKETLSERITETVGSQVVVETHSVVRYDPAIAFGQFVLGGWNEADIIVPPVEKETESEVGDIGKMFLILLLLIGGVALIISLAVSVNNAKAAEAYSTYLAQNKAESATTFTTLRGKNLTLPVDYPLSYKGPSNAGGGPAIRFATVITDYRTSVDRWQDASLTRGPDGVLYGDIYLRHRFSLPFILHVHSAGETEIVYTVERLEEPTATATQK